MTTAEGVLNLKWDDALRLVVQTDSYHYRPHRGCGEDSSTQTDSTQPTKKVTDESASTCSFTRRVCLFFANSSKTRLCVQGTLVAYTLWVATHASRTVPCTVTVSASAANPTKDTSSTGVVQSAWSSLRDASRRLILASPPTLTSSPTTTTTCYVYQSSEGMQLLLKAPMPTFVNVAHAVSGMLLIPLTWVQKETVSHMRFKHDATDGPAPTTPEEKQAALKAARKARSVHSICGIATVASMALMTAGGLMMRANSLFSSCPHDVTSPAQNGTASTEDVRAGRCDHGGCVSRGLDFGKAIIAFAMPWGAFIPGIMASAKLRKVIPHAVVGGLVTKACVAVPLARVLGGLYQRLIGIHIPLPVAVAESSSSSTPTLHIEQAVSGQLERGYYAGIATATVVVGVWAGVDTYKLVTAAIRDVKAKPASRSVGAAQPADAREEL